MLQQPSQICYIALLGERDSMPYTNIPPQSITHNMLRYIGSLPQHMAQFVYGCEYYESSLAIGLQWGYKIIFIYPDSVNTINSFPINENEVRIFLFCTENESLRQIYCSYITPLIGQHSLSIVSKGTGTIGSIPGAVADNKDDVWNWFYNYSRTNYDIRYERLPFSVPFFKDKDFYDTGHVFTPTRVNTQIFNSILGNWGYDCEFTKEEIVKAASESSKKALANKYSFDRQNLILDQIAKIHAVEKHVAEKIGKIEGFEDQFNPPLIITAPYNSAEMRKPINRVCFSSPFEKEMAETTNAVMNFNYTPNYTIDDTSKNMDNVNPVLFGIIQEKFVTPRMIFLDMVGLLHASVRFSPYLRLPTLGQNVNTELAFVGVKNVTKLAQSNKANQSIRKVMEKIGKKMSEAAFSPKCFKMLNKRASQIVAMTDLPIEWIMNDNVPFAFTHDICRLPETPIPSLLAQYEEAFFTPYTIPKDILKKTLVVFGNTDPIFVQHQQAVVKLSEELGFTTKTCLSIADFKETLLNIKPDLLIIDAHGEVDVTTHQSYLWLGEEKLTGDIVVNNRLSSRLVFLSACNTFTTCNTISTIANAFFQAGASSVTTSYMPVNVAEATWLYTRLLKLLSVAAFEPVHKNWLAFISHLQRTSYIQSLITEAKNEDHSKLNEADLAELTRLTSLSMIFRKRRDVYKKLNNTSLAKKMGVNYQYVIPHYLMYSTLGRADLIRFQCYLDKKYEKIENEL